MPGRGKAMLSFLAIVLLVYGTMHFYLLSKLWFALPHSWALAVALAVAGLALTGFPLLVWFLERQGWHRATVIAAWASYSWMAYLFLFLCIGLLLDVGLILARLLDLPFPLSPARTLGIVSVTALILLAYGFFEVRHIRVERISIVTPKLASGRITIAQLSDLHLGIMQGERLLDRIIPRLRELQPDFVVATGDIVDGQGDNFVKLARRFHAYKPPLGAYAVTGNHEYYVGLEHSLQFLRDAGFTVLRGDTARVGGIVLAGVDDPSVAKSLQRADEDERRALASAGEDGFIVLLKHQPRVNEDSPFDLQLSGHIHGGQIFPFVYFTRMAYKFHPGLTELADGRKLYVSRGTGTWGPPIRLFAPPEIALITITSGHD
jgi:predicted MPP superfamily phosphohydrolase